MRFHNPVSRHEFFTPDFNWLINFLYIAAERKRGRLDPQELGPVGDSLLPDVAAEFSGQVLETEIIACTRVNNEHFGGWAIGKDENGRYVIAFNPQQAEADYVPGILHELKHLEDYYAGRVVPPTEELTYTEARRLPSERRARRFEESFQKKLERKRR